MGAVSDFAKIALDCLMQTSKADRFTLVAEWRRQGRDAIIGEASYAFDLDQRCGEFAISVADRWQRQGLGSALLCALQFRAISLGYLGLFGESLKTNVPMKNLVCKAGLAFSRPSDWRAVRFDKTLAGPIAPLPGSSPMAAPSQIPGLAISLRSLRDHFTGPAEFARKVFQFWQSVAHGQDGFGVVDMHTRLEVEIRNRRGEDVDEAERRVGGHQVTAAFRAILPLADRSFLEHRNIFGACRDSHRLRLPETEGVDGSAGPRPAGAAVTIAHRLRRARDLDFDRTAKAFAIQFHS
jgi:GNAT superfamily N-acetyltransferase